LYYEEKEKMKINKISIKYKILLLVTIGIILLTGGIIFRIQGVASSEVNQAAVVKAVLDLELAMRLSIQSFRVNGSSEDLTELAKELSVLIKRFRVK
jgi:hypothetical protein